MKRQLALSSIAIIFAILFLSVACNKKSTEDTPPANTTVDGVVTLTTAAANTVTCASAILGGTISSIGACNLTEHGVVLGTATNPTVSQTKLTDTTITGTGNFSIPATGLAPSTTYYVRAYATNCKGTNYGNEIHFSTPSCGGGGGGGGSDTGWFKLTVDGILYFSYDFYSTADTHVFPEGDTRQATVAFIPFFTVQAVTSRLGDATSSFGFMFQYSNPDVNGTGTYIFGKMGGDKSVQMQLQTGTGAPNFLTNPYYNDYSDEYNYFRTFTTSCQQTEQTCANDTLIITHWTSTVGEFVEGTITGIMYENGKTENNCTNSLAKPYTVAFKLKRVY